MEADWPLRVVRIGSVLWRARLVAPEERPAEAVTGKEYVEVTGSDEKRWLILNPAEFSGMSQYRLRCAILRVASEPEPND